MIVWLMISVVLGSGEPGEHVLMLPTTSLQECETMAGEAEVVDSGVSYYFACMPSDEAQAMNKD